MNKQEQAEKKLEKYNQQQIMPEIEKLNKEEKQNIFEQIVKLDIGEANKIYEETRKKVKEEKVEITPINYIDKEKISSDEKEELQRIGEKIIKSNQYAVVTMAGGQGTRLGFNGPKGTFKLDLEPKGKYIFEILADNLKKSKELYNVLPQWYIMTSEQNNSETKDFFEKHNYFEYEKEKVHFFAQEELPMMTEDGKIVIENNRIKTGSNGNGGVYSAMKKGGVIEDMKKKKIKWIYICGVDNIMVKPIDTIFLGLTAKNNMPVASKSIVKAYPEERVGVFCKKNGKPSTVEYIELTDEMIHKCNDEGELVYGEANFVSHLLNIESIEKIANLNLKYHVAVKNNLYKFETFIFDGFEYLDDMLVMRVKREEEFAPIKNKEGIDSPETAKEIYERNHEKYARI